VARFASCLAVWWKAIHGYGCNMQCQQKLVTVTNESTDSCLQLRTNPGLYANFSSLVLTK
jgi:hypothetical protein